MIFLTWQILCSDKYLTLMGQPNAPLFDSKVLLEILKIMHTSLSTSGYADVADGLLTDIIRFSQLNIQFLNSSFLFFNLDEVQLKIRNFCLLRVVWVLLFSFRMFPNLKRKLIFRRILPKYLRTVFKEKNLLENVNEIVLIFPGAIFDCIYMIFYIFMSRAGVWLYLDWLWFHWTFAKRALVTPWPWMLSPDTLEWGPTRNGTKTRGRYDFRKQSNLFSIALIWSLWILFSQPYFYQLHNFWCQQDKLAAKWTGGEKTVVSNERIRFVRVWFSSFGHFEDSWNCS